MNFKHISVEAAQQLMQQPGTQLVDIRDQLSFLAAHIEGAVHLHNGNLAEFIAEGDLDAPLIVVCYHGNSSQSAAEYLFQQGFEQVYSMDAGFEGWRSRFPFVSVES